MTDQEDFERMLIAAGITYVVGEAPDWADVPKGSRLVAVGYQEEDVGVSVYFTAAGALISLDPEGCTYDCDYCRD